MNLPRAVTLPINVAPLPLVQRVTAMIFNQVLKQHPNLFDRLGSYASKSFRFTPVDLDLSFRIVPSERSISVTRADHPMRADATVTGPMLTLLALLEGHIDGDAIFFARGLTVIGDMEALLALRNALDDNGLDLAEDIGRAAGPFSHLATRVAQAIRQRALTGTVQPWN
ncbi:MAG TPA: SCP2 sterol-binding domain-containing protein [Devosia sp.]|nr:SCP2 sterol-binding domain-containing protein [Devosia sp.]